MRWGLVKYQFHPSTYSKKGQQEKRENNEKRQREEKVSSIVCSGSRSHFITLTVNTGRKVQFTPHQVPSPFQAHTQDAFFYFPFFVRHQKLDTSCCLFSGYEPLVIRRCSLHVRSASVLVSLRWGRVDEMKIENRHSSLGSFFRPFYAFLNKNNKQIKHISDISKEFTYVCDSF
jgi:hypothetical protein